MAFDDDCDDDTMLMCTVHCVALLPFASIQRMFRLTTQNIDRFWTRDQYRFAKCVCCLNWNRISPIHVKRARQTRHASTAAIRTGRTFERERKKINIILPIVNRPLHHHSFIYFIISWRCVRSLFSIYFFFILCSSGRFWFTFGSVVDGFGETGGWRRWRQCHRYRRQLTPFTLNSRKYIYSIFERRNEHEIRQSTCLTMIWIEMFVKTWKWKRFDVDALHTHTHHRYCSTGCRYHVPRRSIALANFFLVFNIHTKKESDTTDRNENVVLAPDLAKHQR